MNNISSMTLKDSWSHFIFHICKCLLEFATRGKHDVRALDVFLGEQSLRSGSFAFQGDTECSEAVQGDSVAWARCSDRRLKTSSSTASIMPCGKSGDVPSLSLRVSYAKPFRWPHTLRMLSWASSCRTHFPSRKRGILS